MRKSWPLWRRLSSLWSDKGHEKLGGRKKSTRNKGTDSIKTLLNTLLCEEELAALWKQKLYSKDPHVALEAFKLANHYLFGKPVHPVVGEVGK